MAPDTTVPRVPLQTGARLRLSKSGGRRGVYELELSGERHGAVKIFGSGDVLLDLDGRSYAIRPPGTSWDLVLLDADEREVTRFSERGGRHGTIGDLTLTFPRRRETAATLTHDDGTPAAEIRIRRDLVVLEPSQPLDPLTAAFAGAVTILHLGYERPEVDPKPVWKPARTAWWAALFGGAVGAELSDWGGADVADFDGGWGDGGI